MAIADRTVRHAALTATLGLAAAAWVVAARQMNGMDMGVATRLGSFASFVTLWVSMMAAMMLPGAAPAVLRRAHASGRVRAVPLFVGEPDRFSPIGTKGLGEIGIVGVSAAIANAVYHATGKRIRSLPITLDKLL
jgi:hypothetical protein